MRLKTRLALIVVLFISAFVVCHSGLQLLSVAERAEAENEGVLPWVLVLLPDHPPHQARTEGEALKGLVHLLRGIDGIRHARIELHAADGLRLAVVPSRTRPVPAWLVRWLVKPVVPVRKDVLDGGRVIAYFEVMPSTADELAEVWEEFVSNTLLVIALSTLAMGLIVWATFRALKPLDRIRDALQLLGDGRGARLPLFRNPEVDGIAASFNRMAEALEASQLRQRTLLRRLIDGDESTRRSVAHDLHDDLSPYLVALQPLARTLEIQCAARPDLQDIGRTAALLISHQSHVLERLRHILMGLHPPDLETFGLRDALGRLARQAAEDTDGARREVDLRLLSPHRAFGATLDVSLYRLVQECLTNARRHAVPRRIDVVLAEGPGADGRACLRLKVDNDGVAPWRPPRPGSGLGLLGMRDRCSALGGSFEAGSPDAAGTRWRVSIELPLDADLDADTSADTSADAPSAPDLPATTSAAPPTAAAHV